jgi:hypothetical protein
MGCAAAQHDLPQCVAVYVVFCLIACRRVGMVMRVITRDPGPPARAAGSDSRTKLLDAALVAVDCIDHLKRYARLLFARPSAKGMRP